MSRELRLTSGRVLPRFGIGARAQRMAFVATAVLVGAVPSDAQWLQFANDGARRASAAVGPIAVPALLWQRSTDLSGGPLVYEGPSSPVVWNGRAYANARHYTEAGYTHNKLVAIDVATGEIVFETLVSKGAFDSWSSPAVDPVTGIVLLASGSALFAIDADDGGIVWQRPLQRIVVNASPLVADGPQPGRAFITDYDPFGGDSLLYCVNLSPFDAATNPFQPGAIVWQEPIGGASGSTAAYADGVVYVATAAGIDGVPDAGIVWAFDVDAPPGARPLWSTAVGEGFYGGVCVRDGSVYSASYDFAGTQNNSTLAKLRASDGAVMWTAPCERTASIPVVSGDRIYLSGGLPGFGSAPKVQAFHDSGTSAVKLWDTYADSGGQLIVGGWSHQMALAGSMLYVGRIPSGGTSWSPYTDLYLLDTSRTPSQPGFVAQVRSGVGSSPALSGGRVYSIGTAGLAALAECADFSGDGRTNGADLQGFVDALFSAQPTAEQRGLADISGDGLLDAADASMLATRLLGL